MRLSSPASFPFQAVMFDLDGLMIDSEPLALRVWQQVLAPHGGALTAEQYQRAIGGDPQSVTLYVIDLLKLDVPLEVLLKEYWQARTEAIEREAEPEAGLLDLISALRGQGVPLAAVSNSPADYVRRSLRRIGLLEAFPCVVASDQVKQGKPAPDVYLEAASQLGVNPAECLAIEDSPAGMRAALQAGMTCFVVPSDGMRREDFDGAQRVFTSLVDVRHYLLPNHQPSTWARDDLPVMDPPEKDSA